MPVPLPIYILSLHVPFKHVPFKPSSFNFKLPLTIKFSLSSEPYHFSLNFHLLFLTVPFHTLSLCHFPRGKYNSKCLILPPPPLFFFDFLLQIQELKRHNFLIFILQCIIIPKMKPCKSLNGTAFFYKLLVMVWWEWLKKSGLISCQSRNILFLEFISHHFSWGENL